MLEIYKMDLFLAKNNEAIYQKHYWGQNERVQESIWKGSHWSKMENFVHQKE